MMSYIRLNVHTYRIMYVIWSLNFIKVTVIWLKTNDGEDFGLQHHLWDMRNSSGVPA